MTYGMKVEIKKTRQHYICFQCMAEVLRDKIECFESNNNTPKLQQGSTGEKNVYVPQYSTQQKSVTAKFNAILQNTERSVQWAE